MMEQKHYAIALLWCALSAAAFADTTSAGYFVDSADAKAFSRPRQLGDDAQADRFMLGRSFFSIPWVAAPSATTARDGLGPLFNANTCTSCHAANSSAQVFTAAETPARDLVFKLGQPSRHADKAMRDMLLPDPVYGGQVAVNATGKVLFEARPQVIFRHKTVHFGDGGRYRLTAFVPKLEKLQYGALHRDTRISIRQAPPLIGLGLIAAIDVRDIVANADSDDRNGDGVSGRVNWVYDRLSGEKRVGILGYKASQPDLMSQIADAAANDMGLTNPYFPQELCTPAQTACHVAVGGRPSPQGALDLPMLRLAAMDFYLRQFKAPRPSPAAAERVRVGRDLFTAIGCTACHRPQWKTRDGIAFAPYSDFLLHDMGSDLADQRPEFEASATEWRTAPLWGSGLRQRSGKRFLHDGRAADLQEAILWHGGEASAAQQRFLHLDAASRAQLIRFLESL